MVLRTTTYLLKRRIASRDNLPVRKCSLVKAVVFPGYSGNSGSRLPECDRNMLLGVGKNDMVSNVSGSSYIVREVHVVVGVVALLAKPCDI